MQRVGIAFDDETSVKKLIKILKPKPSDYLPGLASLGFVTETSLIVL